MNRTKLLSLALVGLAGLATAQDSQPAKKPDAKSDDKKEKGFPSGKVVKEGLTIANKTPEPGEVRVRKSSLEVDMKIEVSGMGQGAQKMDQKISEVSEVQVTITGAEADGTITGLKLEITKYSETMKMTGGPAGGMMPPGQDDPTKGLEGKTYTVETQDDGKQVINDDQGNKVEDFVKSNKLEKMSKSLMGKKAPTLSDKLPKTELKPGAKIEFEDAAVLNLIDASGPAGMKLENKSMVYKGTRKVDGVTCGVFDVRGKIVGDGKAGPGMSIDLGGEVVIEPKRGRVVSIHVTGDLILNSPDPNGPQFKGGGLVTIKRTVGFP